MYSKRILRITNSIKNNYWEMFGGRQYRIKIIQRRDGYKSRALQPFNLESQIATVSQSNM